MNECSNTAVCFINGVSCHNTFPLYLGSASLGIGALLCTSVVTSVTGKLSVNNVPVSALNTVAKSVCNPVVVPSAPMTFKTLCRLFLPNCLCRECVFIIWTSCLLTNNSNINITTNSLCVSTQKQSKQY